MPRASYSSDEMSRDWVYAEERGFKAADGTPAAWAPGHPRVWGNECSKIPLPEELSFPGPVSLNSDTSLIAVAFGQDIHIFDTDNQESRQVLKGHVSRVDTLKFHPLEPNLLVSCNMNHMGGSTPAEPLIIFWDLDEEQQKPPESDTTLEILGTRAAAAVAEGLERLGSNWVLDNEERVCLSNGVVPVIANLNAKYLVRDNVRLEGRLNGSFQSEIFSHDGKYMIFQPGPRPKSNSVAPWNIDVWDISAKKARFSLLGHTDAVMWTGFSPDDKRIGTVSWDKTFRIWDAENGSLQYTFTSDGQNWTGRFSPDSQYFAGTTGSGDAFVWDLTDGAEIARLKSDTSGGQRWTRALSWSCDGKQLAVGGRGLGLLAIFDVATGEVVQERMLSAKNCPKESQSRVPSFLTISGARYLPGGKKIAYKTSGDNGLELYDFEENLKWRFAPDRKQNVVGGGGFFLLPKQGLIASVDGDAIRFWKLSSGDEEG
ncbi:hypothetical protein MMC08_007005 [Hypocenomyce scalaris]|nr:hypothetical protein [Hypocenomyce scalaris]